MKKKRGIFLTGLIIFTLATTMLAVFAFINPSKHYAVSSSSDAIATVIFLAAIVASMIGILMWKKWAIYLLILVYITKAILGFVDSGSKTDEVYYIDIFLTGGLWYLAIRNKWKYFS